MWKATWDIFHNKVSTIWIFHIVMPIMSKITHNLLCKNRRKSRYFCGRILARISGSRKVYEVFHVWDSSQQVGSGQDKKEKFMTGQVAKSQDRSVTNTTTKHQQFGFDFIVISLHETELTQLCLLNFPPEIMRFSHTFFDSYKADKYSFPCGIGVCINLFINKNVM